MSLGGTTAHRHTTLRGIREHNLAVVLSLLHHGGPQTRSRITATTGRNRSTVGALVGELVDRGLAAEAGAASPAGRTNQVGRPSPVVSADPRNLAVAVNPEVDATTVGVVALGGTVIERVRIPSGSAPTAREVTDAVAEVVAGIRGRHAGVVHGIGVAVPGLVRASDGLVRWAPHLEWYDEAIGDALAEATALPVLVGNDASLGAVAERAFGEDRGVSDLVYLNGGASGIGGGVIANGALLQGALGYAGEFGHIRVEPDPAGGRETGSLESRVRRSDLLDALGLGPVDADELEAALLASGDPHVAALVRRQLDFLGTSVRNIVNVLNPERVVLGGFLGSLFAADPDHLLRRVEEQSLALPFEAVSVRRPSLGSDLLMIGAAELVFERLLDRLRAGALPRGAVPAG